MCTYLVHITHRIHIVQREWVHTGSMLVSVTCTESKTYIHLRIHLNQQPYPSLSALMLFFALCVFFSSSLVHLIHFLGIWKLVEAHTDIQPISMQASSMHPSIHPFIRKHSMYFSESECKMSQRYGQKRQICSLSSVRRMYIHHWIGWEGIPTRPHWMVMVNIHIMFYVAIYVYHSVSLHNTHFIFVLCVAFASSLSHLLYFASLLFSNVFTLFRLLRRRRHLHLLLLLELASYLFVVVVIIRSFPFLSSLSSFRLLTR